MIGNHTFLPVMNVAYARLNRRSLRYLMIDGPRIILIEFFFRCKCLTHFLIFFILIVRVDV